MSIRRRVLASTALAVAATLACAVMLWIGASRSIAADVEQEHVQATSRMIAGLVTLTNEYALHAEPRAAQQWQQQHEALSRTLAAPVQSGETSVARLALRASAADLPALFQHLTELNTAPGTALTQRQRELLVDQLLARTQALADAAYRWSHEAAATEQAARLWLRVGAAAALLVLLGTTLAQPVIVWRRVLQPLAVLERAAMAVERGDLTARCASTAPDELGRVARRFDAMTLALDERSAELMRLARYDSLTGLPNRREFDERLADAMARSRRTRCPIALLFLDIDHFKAINDSLGHAAGDTVLKEFARRLKDTVRLTDTVARLAGDEFVIVLEMIHAASDAAQVARKLAHALHDDFAVEGTTRKITASIGVALFEAEATTNPGELMARADAALYQAKSAGRDRFCVAPSARPLVRVK